MVKDYKKIDPWQLTNELAIQTAWSLRSDVWSLKSEVWCLKSEVQRLNCSWRIRYDSDLDILIPVYYDDCEVSVLLPWNGEFSL